MRRWAPVVVVIAVAAVVFLSVNRPQGPVPPFEVSIWYWHSPFYISEEDATLLEEMGVRRLFVRAGTFSFNGEDIVLVLPQEYDQDSVRYPLTLVFPFDAGAVRHIEELETERLAERVAERVLAQVDAVEDAGFTVEGIQLDLDCPTRLLPRYAKIVETLRAQDRRLNKSGALKLSATGLVTWFGERDLDLLAEQLDFIVPQVYEGQVSMRLETARPISNPQVMASLIEKAERLPCPYYVGLPAYGRATLFDNKGEFAGVYHGLSPREALEHDAFEPLSMNPVDVSGLPTDEMEAFSGETFLKLRAVQSAPDGRGLGYTLLFSIPTPTQLHRSYKAALVARSSNCLGGIVFRYPEPEESLVESFVGQIAAIKDENWEPDIMVVPSVRSLPFSALQSQDGARADLTLTVENSGRAATAIAPNAIVIEIDVAKGSFDGTVPRRVVGCLTGVRTVDGFRETGWRDADCVRLFLAGLRAGEITTIGPIFFSETPPANGNLSWTVLHEDGIESTRGERPLSVPGDQEK